MKCARCKREPKEIQEYIIAAKQVGTTPDKYVKSEEGTYNRKAETFYCTNCYIRVGMPSGKAPELED